jgi:hypothetical protein
MALLPFARMAAACLLRRAKSSRFCQHGAQWDKNEMVSLPVAGGSLRERWTK